MDLSDSFFVGDAAGRRARDSSGATRHQKKPVAVVCSHCKMPEVSAWAPPHVWSSRFDQLSHFNSVVWSRFDPFSQPQTPVFTWSVGSGGPGEHSADDANFAKAVGVRPQWGLLLPQSGSWKPVSCVHVEFRLLYAN